MEQTGVTEAQSLLIVIVAWIIFPVLQTAPMLLLPVGLNKVGRRANGFLLVGLTASLYVVIEWIQSWFFTGLTWAKLSLSQYYDIYTIQSVSLLGTYAVSFIIVAINAVFALYLIKADGREKLAMGAIALYFANAYFGMFRVMTFPEPDSTVKAVVVQGNVSSYNKWEESGVQYSLDRYVELTDNALEDYDADIVLWPETAIPTRVTQSGSLKNTLSDYAEQRGIKLFTGILYEDKMLATSNAVMPFGERENAETPYAKRHLVPFGEYLPAADVLTKLFPFVTNISLFDDPLTQGTEANLLTADGVSYGSLVCFDSIFPELARISVREGADIILVVTNDSWFRDSPALYQHNSQSVLRAVETGRTVLRAANTGISSVISPTGEIIARTNADEQATLTAEAGIYSGTTPYVLCGDLMLYASGAVIIWAVIVNVKSRKKRNKSAD
ncbi:hypothetical protein FACS1894219_01070 [Clostridia bacterium]|nr:hypothetical protein FACS1894219_01070 [Clostridia bacterium]